MKISIYCILPLFACACEIYYPADISASANLEPRQQLNTFKVAVAGESYTRGPFEITQSTDNIEFQKVLGDGFEEITEWTFDFSSDPESKCLAQADTIESAKLLIVLQGAHETWSDYVGFGSFRPYGEVTPSGGVNVSPQIFSVLTEADENGEDPKIAGAFELDPVSEGLIAGEDFLNEIRDGDSNTLDMIYHDDATVLHAEMTLRVEKCY